MEKKNVFRSDNPLPKGETATSDDRVLTRVEGNLTYMAIQNFARRYKLEKAYSVVRNLEMRSDKKIEIQSFRNFKDKFKGVLFLPLNAEEKARPVFAENERYLNTRINRLYPKGTVLVMVSDLIYAQVQASIDQYVKDLAYDGYWASIHVVNGGTPQQMRTYIRQRNPVGVVLVGALPVPWFEMANDFHDASSEFPCDLYYMDTNGTWGDPDGDGKFENHNGDLDPEIWVGRIWSPTMNGNNADLINNYFERNHLFRVGQLGHSMKALAYVDDDWQGFNDCGMSMMVPASAVTTYTSPNQTDSDLYKSEVNTLRSWVQLCAHSWVGGHSFTVNTGNEWIDVPYFRDTNPPNAHFYNLFCCGPGRFTQDNYLAGWYIFDNSGGSTNYGLAAIASAKTGSMLMFEDFYGPMGQGKTIGEAFVEWWKARGPVHDLGEQQWYYGLVLLGDPTLNWWKGAVPVLRQPQEGDVFNHWPRRIELRWDPVNIPSVKYEAEVDYFTGTWAAETGRPTTHYHNLSNTVVIHNFVGMQPGRWRVRAIIGGQLCSWSPWSYFRFDI
jgi:Peptidase family C25